MAGLESIAMALLHLEREERVADLPPASAREEHDPEFASTSNTSCAILPKRSGFTGPRLVSTDFSTSDDKACTSDSASGTFAEVAENQLKMTLVSKSVAAATTTQESSPPLQAASREVSFGAGSLETLSDMDIFDANTQDIPPLPKPTDTISLVLQNDVLCGRGGETNHHAGNIQYRQLVKASQPSYIAAKRRDKPKIAEKIVRTVRKLGGRFLKKNPETPNTWKDVGNTKAREKTSQALREGAPELREGKEQMGSIITNTTTTTTTKDSLSTKRRASVPRVVEAALINMDSPAYKKLKMTLSDLADAAADGTTSSCLSQTLQRGTLLATRKLPLSPGGFTATISADDEEDTDSKSVETKSSRGPRLKLLKRRLECEDTSI